MISFEAGSPSDAGDHDRGNHVFEAIHTPPPVREVTSAEFREAKDGRESSQENVLEALDDSKPFLFVTGIPGTGKSHLIRWLHLNREHTVKNPEEIQAYVPRSMTRLREVLKTVLQYAEPDVRERLERDVDAATTGLDQSAARGQLLANLAQVIEDRAPAIRSGSDSAFQQRAHVEVVDDLHELLRAKPVREHLCRDGGSIDRMVTTRVTGQRSGDMSADEELRIQLDELQSLASIRAHGLSKEADRLLSKISNDQGVRTAAHQLLGPVHSDPALQRLVGLSVGQMQEAMTDLLASLHAQGRRLALYFEDWGLISGLQEELAEAIAAAPAGSVLAVVAITTDRLQEQRNNVLERGRIFVMDPPSTAVPGAELRRAHPGADLLAGRALNAVRWGRDELEKRYAQRTSGQAWLESKCENCPFDVRQTCHESFGSVHVDGVGDVGFFPFSETALRNALTRKSGGGAAVPRVVLHEVIRSALGPTYASQLEPREFPSPAFSEEFRAEGFQLSAVQDATLQRTLDEQSASHESARAQAFLEVFRDSKALETFDDRPRVALELPPLGESRPAVDPGDENEEEGEDVSGQEVEVPPLAQEAFSLRSGGTVTAERELKELAAREVLVGLPVDQPIWRRTEWAKNGLDHTHVSLGDKAKYAASGPNIHVKATDAEALGYLAWSFAREGSWQEIESVAIARAHTDSALDRWIANAVEQLVEDQHRERLVESLMRVLAASGVAIGIADDLTMDNVLEVIFSDPEPTLTDELAKIGVGGNGRTESLDILYRYIVFAQGSSGEPIAIDYDFVAPIAQRIVEDPKLPSPEGLPEGVPEWAQTLGAKLLEAIEKKFGQSSEWWAQYGEVFGDRNDLVELLSALRTLRDRVLGTVNPETKTPILKSTERDQVRKLEVSIDRLNESLDMTDGEIFEDLLRTREMPGVGELPLAELVAHARRLQDLEPFRNQLRAFHMAALELLGTVEGRIPSDVKLQTDTSLLDEALDMARAAGEELGGQ